MSKSSGYQYYPITGIQPKATAEAQSGPNRKVPVRQNIDTWSSDKANEKQVKLFVLALDRFQKIDPAKRESFYQVAGIHGQPNLPWDEPEESQTKGKGYCTHNNVLFPIWHRIYLSLYEQRLYELMTQEIIPGFPENQRSAWQEAADSWRLPFWDWGISNSVPKLAKTPMINVPTADGKGEELIRNPFYQFVMPNNQPMSKYGMEEFRDPWIPDNKGEILHYGDCIGTSRWPEKEDIEQRTDAWKHGVVNNYKVTEALTKPPWVSGTDYGQAAEMVYRLLTVPMDYATFATTAQPEGADKQNVSNDLNIEYIHNNVHGWVGGDFNGHMSQIPVATFDPLFWLHHANIDRIWALWQALNPTKWFESSKVNYFFQEIIGMPQNTVITPKTALRPFHADAKGTPVIASDARSIYKLGYTYPELQTWDAKYKTDKGYDEHLFTEDLRKTINNLYGVSRKALLGASNLKGVEYLDDGIKSMDYAFSIRFRKYAFGGEPFWIRLYLSQDGKTQNATTDLITEVYNFSQKPEVGDKVACDNCKINQKNNLRVTAYISITPVLVKLLQAGKNLGSLSKKDVLEYIQKRAYWRVFKHNKLVQQFDVDKLELEIVGSTNNCTTYNDPTKPPLLENFTAEPSITGGGDGALDPSLKQPVVAPPPVVPNIPKATLELNKSLPFKEDLKADGVVIIDSSKLDLTKAKTNTIDNTQFWLTDGADGKGNILFLLSLRRAENQIVFNTFLDNQWGKEVRVSLDGRFKGGNPSILVHDQGDGWEVFIDWVHVQWFEKRAKGKVAKAICYGVNENQNPVLAHELNVKVYKSMKEVFHH